MGRGFIFQWQLSRRGRLSRQGPEPSPTYAVLAILSDGCPPLEGTLPTCYAPVRHFTRGPKPSFSFDLHVLSPPLTFALSQDQTLQLKTFTPRPLRTSVRFQLESRRTNRGRSYWLRMLVRKLKVSRVTGDVLGACALRTIRSFHLGLLFSFQRPTRTSCLTLDRVRRQGLANLLGRTAKSRRSFEVLPVPPPVVNDPNRALTGVAPPSPTSPRPAVTNSPRRGTGLIQRALTAVHYFFSRPRQPRPNGGFGASPPIGGVGLLL